MADLAEFPDLAEFLDEQYAPTDVVQIGSGTYSVVYRATGPGLDIVVKASKFTIYDDHSFLNEWVVLAAVDHANIIRLHRCVRLGDRLVLVMPYIGTSVHDELTDAPHPQLAVWAPQLYDIVAVLQAHHIVHKDISFANLLVRHDDRDAIVLCDFGIANHSNPYDVNLATSLPVRASTLAELDGQCVEYILDALENGADLEGMCVAHSTEHVSSFQWSHWNVTQIARLAGESYDFVNTFLMHSISAEHTPARCAAIIDCIIGYPRIIFDNTRH